MKGSSDSVDYITNLSNDDAFKKWIDERQRESRIDLFVCYLDFVLYFYNRTYDSGYFDEFCLMSILCVLLS